MEYTNYIKINIENLKKNIDYLKKNYVYKNYILDVSSNAFNHGMYLINHISNLINYLYCSSFNDIILIRKYNQEIPIIYNGIITSDNIYDLIINNVILIIKNTTTIDEILSLNIKDNIEIILNIDISNHNGFNSQKEINQIKDKINNSKISLIGLKANNINPKNLDEYSIITNSLKDLKLIILNDELNKNKINNSNSIKLDYSVYGFNCGKKSLFKKEPIKLKQIFSLNTKIINIKKDNQNKKLKYIATIPFGKLQGLTDNLKKVYIKNQLYNIIAINEDYSLIEIDENININENVEIISDNNPLEDYYYQNPLLYLSIFNNNLPILYADYTLEKTFVY